MFDNLTKKMAAEDRIWYPLHPAQHGRIVGRIWSGTQPQIGWDGRNLRRSL